MRSVIRLEAGRHQRPHPSHSHSHHALPAPPAILLRPRRQCIDRSAYLYSKYTGEGNATELGRTAGLSLAYALGAQLPEEAAHRLFGWLAPRYAGEEGRKAWTKEQTDWTLCNDLSPEEYKERVQVLWAREHGIYR